MSALLRFKQSIAKQLEKHTVAKTNQLTLLFRYPKKRSQGHISLSMLKLQSSLKEPDQDLGTLAKQLVENFETNELITTANQKDTNLFFHFNETEYTKRVLLQVAEEKDKYGWQLTERAKPILIDYSSPNIAKPFHAGHLRSTIIGNFIRRIHEAFGYNVIGINYLGDWGKQYGLLAVGFQKYGSEEELLHDPIHHLYKVYVKINAEAKEDPDIDRQANEYFKRMEQGDEKALAQWRRFRDMSIQSYASIYKRLNIIFDVYSGESQVNDYIPKVHALLEQKGLLTHTPEGAVAVNLEEYNLGQAVVKRSDGTTLYLTRDLANILMRKELYKDYEKAFYVVGTEQQGYFKQVFKIAQLMLDDAPQLEHIGFGRVKGMSTRKGTVIFLQDILDTAKDKILDYMKQSETKNLIQGIDEVADQLGVSGILVRDMKAKRIKDYVFDWDSMMDTKGDTGVFLQYAHARACGIERKANVDIVKDCDFSLLKEKEAIQLVDLISKFPEAVEQSFETLEPSTIVNYLFKLSHATSSASKMLRVKDVTDQQLARARMLMFWSARITLSNGLRLLGIESIKHM